MRSHDTSLDPSAQPARRGPRRSPGRHVRAEVVAARRALTLVVAMTGLAAAPGQARAWTEARVRTVATRLTLPPDGEGPARLELAVDVAVRRGWLERLDVPGLPPGTTPAPGVPAVARALQEDDGGTGRGAAVRGPEVSVTEAGTLRLDFPGGRRRAPGRGRYRIRVPLDVPFEVEPLRRAGGARPGGAPDPVHRLRLPPWNAGLDLPRMVFEAPYPIAPLAAPGAQPETGVQVRVEVGAGGLHRVVYDRVHLPRQTAWETGVRIPRETAPRALGKAPGDPRDGLRASNDGPPTAGGGGAGATGAEPSGAVLGPGGRRGGLSWPGLVAVAVLLGVGLVLGPGGRRAILRPPPEARALAWGRRGWLLGSLGLAVTVPALPEGLALPGADGSAWALVGLAVAGLAAFPARPAERWLLRGGDPFDGRTPLGLAVLAAGGLGVVALEGSRMPGGDGLPEALASALALAAVPWFATPAAAPASDAAAAPVAPVLPLRPPSDDPEPSPAARGEGQRSRAASAR